jgi:beta-barrel assembly-enhancing protease
MSRVVVFLTVGLLFLSGISRGDDPPAKTEVRPRAKPAPKTKRTVRGAAERNPDLPPPCAHQTAATQPPPATSMPELFDRMSQGFATNPAGGFESWLGELARLEGPALEGVTLTVEEERRAGRKARDEYLERAASGGHKVLRDPKRLAYLQALVDRLAARMKERVRYPKVEVTLIDAPISDGQSFPGGFLVFTSALLDEPDEATVAGVICHELAHLDLGHLHGYARRAKLMERGPAGSPDFEMSFDKAFTHQAALFGLMMNPFRPEHEIAADCAATTWMFLEGYDPNALVRWFERLNQRRGGEPGNSFFSFARTHPDSLQRRREVVNRLAQLKRWRPQAELELFADNLRRLEPRARNGAAPAGK